jgi:hypothetical protein
MPMLTPTMPVENRSVNHSATRPEVVYIAAAFPKGEEFSIAIASSFEWTCKIDNTGPKISS